MLIKFSLKSFKAATLGLTAFFVFGCSDVEQKIVPVKEEIKVETKSNGVVYQPSELAATMRAMYSNMKLVNALLDSGRAVPDSLLTGYQSMLTDTPTNPDEIGPKFYGFAEGWLLELAVLKEEPTKENYNALMNACVHCHQSFCPGPIKKIKRLKLIGGLE
jgi:hypothetical protein